MTNEITKNLQCIVLRNGVEIWIEEDRIVSFKQMLLTLKENKLVSIDGEFINTADIVGILDAKTVEDSTRRKNGQWKDKNGNWQDKGTRSCPKCGNILPWGKTCGFCS
jgi:hypothetical protein